MLIPDSDAKPAPRRSTSRPRSILLSLVLLASASAAQANPAAEGTACPPPGTSRESLAELARGGFAIENPADRDRLAVALLACLGDPDPALRDGVVFEGLSHWLRAKELSPATIPALASELAHQLEAPADPAGFRRPFAALVLSEVVRADRIDPVLDEGQRGAIVDLAAKYLGNVDDYRGFDEAEGWRHGVAHGADLALQLAVHPQVTAPQVEKLMTAVAKQVAPAGAVFYVYGEPGRLARVVYFAHRRGVLDKGWWAEWFRSLSDPAPLPAWRAAFQSQAGLAKRHNTLAFFLAVLFAGQSGGDEAGAELAKLAQEALVRVHGG